MSLKHIQTVLRKEMLDTVRDRRTLFASVLVPVMLMPAMILGIPLLFAGTEVRLEEQSQTIAIINPEESQELIDLIRESDSLILVDPVGGGVDTVRNGNASIVLELSDQFGESLSQETPGILTIYFDASSRRSTTAYSKVQVILGQFNQIIINERLEVREIDRDVIRPLSLFALNVATEEEVSGFVLSLILPPILAMLVATGGMNAAMDMTVGEKERHTLEALLVTSAKRWDLVAGKFLAVLAVTLLTSLVLILSLVFWIQGPLGTGFGSPDQSLSLSFQTSLIIFGVLALLAVMLSGLSMAVSTLAKSFREAGNYVSPVIFLVLAGSFGAFGISIEDASLNLFAIPILNITLIVEEVLLNKLNFSHLGLTIGVTALLSLVTIYFASWVFKREGVLFRT